MSTKSTATKPEDVIKELRSLVVEVKYTEKNKSIKPKLDKSSIWTMAQKVGKHWYLAQKNATFRG